MTPRDLPSVHEVLERIQTNGGARFPHALVVLETRRALQAAREALQRNEPVPDALEKTVEAALQQWTSPSLKHVINATGVVLHTNLGRAPLAGFGAANGFSNLEYNLTTGRRGNRDDHIGRLLEALLGKPAIAVNNGAAALFLILNELASGGEAIVSRGELIEIGDGFRIPEIMQRSGAVLREVGTTNRTHISDYREAITDRTRILLRVHPSNFSMTGFTARAGLGELVELGRERSIPVYEDLGSGCVKDLKAFGIDEPLVQDSLAAGVNLVSFSGDKLLGGPQAGIIAGDDKLVARVRRNPLFRAFRQDKLFFHAMETTLRHLLLEQYDSIPALNMIRLTAEQIRVRAEALAARLKPEARVIAGESVTGGGSTPDKTLPTYVIELTALNAANAEKRLRAGSPPIIVRIEKERVVIDLRTVFPEEEDAIVQALSW